MSRNLILGISAHYHDSAAALVENGDIVAAAQEERFTRIKGDASFPHHAIGYCLDAAGITESELDHIVFYENPVAKFDRLLTMAHAAAPGALRSFLESMPSWTTKKLWLRRQIASELGVPFLPHACDHHMAHAASAFYPSPFDRAAVLTVDGVGEWSTSTWGVGNGRELTLHEHTRFPNSLGLLYSAFTSFTGFRINSGEYKLMGLAPYGKPLYQDLIRTEVVRIDENGSIVLNQRYFDYVGGLTMTNGRFHALFGGEPRRPESPLTKRECDLAASIQAVVEEVMLRKARYVHARTGERRLVLAGGVALNVVANGRIAREGPFEEIWVQPAAGDAGGALGCALWYWHSVLGHERDVNPRDSMRGAFLGPEIEASAASDDELLLRLGGVWSSLDDERLAATIAAAVADGKVVGVARGRMELGPRALGARSILGDARLPTMQSQMNLKIKFRESFRPFAPVVLRERCNDYFDLPQASPYMMLTGSVVPERRVTHDGEEGLEPGDRVNLAHSAIPAVTHVDHSARVQTIDRERNPFLHSVLSRFEERTGCPVMINTSFNVRGEPIVRTAEDAYRCFMATEIDCVAIGNRWLVREEQRNRPLDDRQRAAWLRRFELD